MKKCSFSLSVAIAILRARIEYHEVREVCEKRQSEVLSQNDIECFLDYPLNHTEGRTLSFDKTDVEQSRVVVRIPFRVPGPFFQLFRRW